MSIGKARQGDFSTGLTDSWVMLMPGRKARRRIARRAASEAIGSR